MKLGTQTGSVINHIYTRGSGPEPEVGMGVTICHWTDREAGTIVRWDGKILTVQGDKTTRTDNNGMSECQVYTYERCPDAAPTYWRRDKDGRWEQIEQGYEPEFKQLPAGNWGWGRKEGSETGRWRRVGGRKGGGPGLSIGRREAYHDFSF